MHCGADPNNAHRLINAIARREDERWGVQPNEVIRLIQHGIQELRVRGIRVVGAHR